MDDHASWATGRLLLVAARLVEREWNAVLAERGLTHAGFLALHVLQDGPRTQRELAARTYVEEQTIRPVLDRLERDGHIARERDTADRRRVMVTRTDLGKRTYAEIMEGDPAERIIADRVEDPEALRAELIRLITGIRDR
ncbi:MarR family winged helix-turn-helix transcriptional regulator [Streptosporangium saharense]|uniref:DNA-binding MarR family transcriptional regulator n=1 Tax=Streptosporangium saharense TaxID=1706840 RepID=A0A7W7QQ45_9ACTN|nr:MarR family transcriptional regulator [Streptosporangium saharense]MBB4917722.1 DNA-binding MarR family transcriptional regulator [Streptosporangium saharense]